MRTKKCRLCPYASVCYNICYDTEGESSCDHALQYDALAQRAERKDKQIKKLKTKLAAEKSSNENDTIVVRGDYVLTSHRNAFNDKTSWWLSKKGCTVAVYCFSASSQKEVEYQLGGIDGYIKILEAALVPTGNPERSGAERVIDLIMEHLPRQPRSESVDDDPGYWTNGTDILCPSEMECETIADFLDNVLREESTMTTHTGHYDPAEDGAEADESTGYYYIDFD